MSNKKQIKAGLSFPARGDWRRFRKDAAATRQSDVNKKSWGTYGRPKKTD